MLLKKNDFFNAFTVSFLVFGIFTHISTLILDPNIIAPYLLNLGASSIQIGFLSSLIVLSSIYSFFVAYMLTKIGSHKRTIIIFTGLSFISILIITLLAPILPADIVIYLVISMFFFYCFFFGFTNLPMNDMYRVYIPREAWITFNSVAAGFFVLITTFGSLLSKWLLDHPSIPFRTSYQIFFAVASLFILIQLFAVLFLPKYEVQVNKQENSIVNFFKSEWQKLRKDKQMIIFLIATFLFAVLWSNNGLFLSIGYKIDALRMEQMMGDGIFWRSLVKSILFFLAGWIAYKYQSIGNQVSLYAIVGFTSMIPLLILTSSANVLLTVIILTNITGMYHIYLLSYLFRNSDDSSFKGKYIMYTLAHLPSAAISPILGYVSSFSALLFCGIMIGVASLTTLCLIKLRQSN
jgi:MFS family permease